MSIKLAVAGRPHINLSEENITLGSDPSCAVSFPESSGLMPKHAVIRKIAGRWLIEVREADAIFVGGPDPKRLFWLNPGDTVKLTENGPAITFQPLDDDPLPLPIPASKVVLPPDSSPSLPVTRPKSSAAIRVPKSPSSGTIKVPKSPSSGTIRTVPPSSASMRTVDSSNGTNHHPTKLSRSGTNHSVPGTPVKGHSEAVHLPPMDDDEPTDDVPTLQRVSSWDDDPSQRGGLTEEQAELRWIMMVVGRSVGAGLVVLVLWIAVTWIMKSMKPVSIDSLSPPPSAQQSSATSSTPSSPPTQQPAQPPSFGTEIDNPKAASDRDTASKKKSADKDKAPTKPPTKPQVEKPSENSSENPKPAGTARKDPGARKPQMEQESPAPNQEMAGAPAFVKAAKDGLYAVIMEDSGKSKQIQLGTAFAASKRHLITTATVVSAIEEHQQQGMVATVVQVTTGKSIRIKSTRMHDSYRKAVDAAEEAREQRDASRLATERANMVRFDLGVLDLNRNERLPKKIPSYAEPMDESKESIFVAVGIPFQAKEDADSVNVEEESIKERRCKKAAGGTAPQNKDMELTIQFGPDSNGRNWSGSPVLNKEHKVIGVYSQIPSTGPTGGKPVKPEYGVAWIGRLHEFASDVD